MSLLPAMSPHAFRHRPPPRRSAYLFSIIGAALLAILPATGTEPPRQGALVLQFDDGWTAWRTLVAPELARVGGKATAFVNNQYIHNGRVSFEDLRQLQNTFGWEIGTHSYTHEHPPRYAEKHGLEQWLANQLERSISELTQEGLRVRQLVFPFNAYTADLAREALDRVGSYRRADPLALASGPRPDGSLPGTSIDLTRYTPLRLQMQWVDLAQSRNSLLLLFGHRILPDDAFRTGRVVSVSPNAIVAETVIDLPPGEDIVLVPDADRRGVTDSLKGITIDGTSIRVPAGSPDLTRLTAPGSMFLIGPAYGTRLSDFRALITYAAERLNFLTVSEAVNGIATMSAPPAALPTSATTPPDGATP